MLEFKTESVGMTESLAYILGQKLPYGTVIALFGDLGAGKTSFTRGFAAGMNINADVSSPTFALVNEYRTGNKTLCHFDMYRVNNFEDLYSTGFYDYLDSGCSVIIEWSENIENVLPDDCIKIKIDKCDNDNERIIKIIGCDNIEITQP